MLVIQSRPALWDTMDCSPPGSSVHGIRMDKNIGMGCRSLLQGIFPTQGLNPSLLHCRWILYRLSHQGSLLVNNNNSSCFLSVYWGSSIFRAFTGTTSPCNNPGPQVLLQLPFDGKEKQSTEHCQQGRATHLLTGTTGINTQAGGSRPHTMPSATSPLQGRRELSHSIQLWVTLPEGWGPSFWGRLTGECGAHPIWAHILLEEHMCVCDKSTVSLHHKRLTFFEHVHILAPKFTKYEHRTVCLTSLGLSFSSERGILTIFAAQTCYSR